MPKESFEPRGIARLPIEILDRIFLLALEIPEPLGTLHPDSTPWTLGAVSKSWRDLVLSRPQLWARIELNLNEIDLNDYEPHDHPMLDVLSLMLQRSSSSPLTIIFSDDPSFIPTGPAKYVMERLIKECERWLDVSFNITFDLFGAFSSIRGKLPVLSRLSLAPYGAQTFAEFTAFEIAPKLESVSLLRVDNIRGYKFPFHQLKELKGPLYDGHDLFEQTPLMEDFEIEFSPSDIPESATTGLPLIERPHLRRLMTNMLPFHKALRAPELTELEIYAQVFRSSVWEITTFIETNRCALTSLIIAGRHDWPLSLTVTPNQLQDFLELLPCLETLVIVEFEGHQYTGVPWAAIATYLTVDDLEEDDENENEEENETDEAPYVPYLKQISFKAQGVLGHDILSRVERMVRSRVMYSGGNFSAQLAGFERTFRTPSWGTSSGFASAVQFVTQALINTVL